MTGVIILKKGFFERTLTFEDRINIALCAVENSNGQVIDIIYTPNLNKVSIIYSYVTENEENRRIVRGFSSN